MTVDSMTEDQARQVLRAIELRFTIYNGSVDLLEMEKVGGTIFQTWRLLREKLRKANGKEKGGA
jgi:hypothetical protein